MSHIIVPEGGQNLVALTILCDKINALLAQSNEEVTQ